MSSVTVYSRPGCHLCVEVVTRLGALREELGFDLHELDIEADEQLQRAFFERIPVVVLDGEEVCEHVLDEPLLRERLESRR